MKYFIFILSLLLRISSINAQNFWENTNFPQDQSTGSLVINSGGQLFAGVLNTGMLKSDDDGENWFPVNDGLTIPNIIKLDINKENGSLFASGYDINWTEHKIFRSTDNGNSWKALNSLPQVYYIICINQVGHIYVGNYLAPVSVLVSTDNGDSWISTNWASPVSIVFNSYGHIFMSFENLVYRSTDNGNNWTIVTNGLPNLSCGWFAINSEGDIFLTQYGGPLPNGIKGSICRSIDNGDSWSVVYEDLLEMGNIIIDQSGNIHAWSLWTDSVFIRSTNNGSTWTDISSGLQKKSFSSISSLVYNQNNKLFVSCDGNIYRSVGATSGVKEYSEEMPTNFILGQNYPNPFNPSTTIRYSIPASLNPSQGGALVILKVYDLLGREMTTLVNKVQTAGVYEIEFDAGELSSGIYIYKLQSGGFVESKKMILLE